MMQYKSYFQIRCLDIDFLIGRLFRIRSIYLYLQLYFIDVTVVNEDVIRFYRNLAQRLHMSRPLLEDSIRLHNAVGNSQVFQGRSHFTIASAIIYFMSRINNTPYTIKEISDASGVPRKDIARCYRLLLKEKREFKKEKTPEQVKEALLMNIRKDDTSFAECPKCFRLRLLYHDEIDTFRCSICHASWRRLE